jgi:hypothetical protein
MKKIHNELRISRFTTSLSYDEININDNIMNLKEAAPFLGKSVGAVRKMCQRKQIPAHRVHYRWYFLKSELIIWLKNQ